MNTSKQNKREEIKEKKKTHYSIGLGSTTIGTYAEEQTTLQEPKVQPFSKAKGHLRAYTLTLKPSC
ncbi:hypothetical protein Tdes44962_MAKER08134 [Teratosphaeria destructans]|uniref:Uncharacterized protein n=1 Tax=Teratosphaeria destructans TaxID=418781 RepID=A0A9W7SWZ1_9PEZI|nr:hypothetical protein Tdes44962_MAKER08134 [Teratosphaeria destructans]